MAASPYLPIRDLEPSDVADPKRSIPTSLARVWERSRDRIVKSVIFERLAIRWGTELGLVEDVFRWDRGVTETLVESGIDVDVLVNQAGQPRETAERNAQILRDHVSVLTGLVIGFMKQEPLTEVFIRQLHQKLLSSQHSYEALGRDRIPITLPLERGAYKKQANSPSSKEGEIIHHYCPPADTPAEMQRLCELFRDSPALADASPSVRASWLHHRFVSIHPFADGNGRVARTLATMVLLRAGLMPLLVRRDEHRSGYIDALRRADAGDLDPLVTMVIARQVDEITTAYEEVPKMRDASEAIAEATKALYGALELRLERAQQLFIYACQVGAGNHQNSLSAQLAKALASATPRGKRYTLSNVKIVPPGGEDAHTYDDFVGSVAKGYAPRTEDIAGYWSVAIQTEERFRIVLHLHERVADEGGGLAISAFALLSSDDGDAETSALRIGAPFLVPLSEAAEQKALQAAREWGADTLTAGLALWVELQH